MFGSFYRVLQLGHGEDRSISHVPRRVEGLRSYWVITAAAGGRHSVVLAVKRSVMPSPDAVWLASIDYQIWAWGENEFGQLGVGDHSARAVPTEVTKLQSLRCVNIAAGGEHTITRTCLGHIYTWGAVENSDGRVTRDRVTPVRLPYFDGKGVVAIAASSKASILLGASGTSDLSVVYVARVDHRTRLSLSNTLSMGLGTSLGVRPRPARSLLRSANGRRPTLTCLHCNLILAPAVAAHRLLMVMPLDQRAVALPNPGRTNSLESPPHFPTSRILVSSAWLLPAVIRVGCSPTTRA